MQLIPCPNCGPREEIEFHYGGQAGVPYPADPAALDDVAWAGYLFFRDNPRGPFGERWYHSGGCRRWFSAVRDTETYRFLSPAGVGGRTPNNTIPDVAEPEPAPATLGGDDASGHRRGVR